MVDSDKILQQAGAEQGTDAPDVRLRRWFAQFTLGLLAVTLLVGLLLGIDPGWFGLIDAPGFGRLQISLLLVIVTGLAVIWVFRRAILHWVEARFLQLSLLACSLIVFVSIGEIIVRIAVADWIDSPTMVFVSIQPFEASGDGVAYKVDQKIRQYRVAGAEVEYDVTYSTNNVGCVDDSDYRPGSQNRRILFLGDSFTAGFHGGLP